MITLSPTQTKKPTIEAKESWELAAAAAAAEALVSTTPQHRQLKGSHHHHHKNEDARRQALLGQLYNNPGIQNGRVHGMMIDAGSTGSRLHIYEWKPRVLSLRHMEEVANGDKLSYPGTHTRWTDRLTPGISTFAAIDNEQELLEQVAEYFRPLLDFARTVLHEKEDVWDTYPIYLRATAGMRTLERYQRARVMKAVRTVFANSSIQPFMFDSDEQARVISGEEEAVFDWTAVNFLMGNLVDQSEGIGTVRPSLETHGALDLGGASTQISFYEPDEDIMSNLFKLQIGQSKHWNIYAHSFLFYGMNEAINRFGALLASDPTYTTTTLIHNPCLPVGRSLTVHTGIKVENGMETWASTQSNFTMFNNNIMDVDLCFDRVQELLHLPQNAWCEFAHRGDCALAGVYQPQLPRNSEFVAFSNYERVWTLLHLPESATVQALGDAARLFCAKAKDKVPLDDPHDCFRAVYAYQLLSKGYKFAPHQRIRAVKVVGGQHVGWALGAMLYEINTLPWHYQQDGADSHSFPTIVCLIAVGAFVALWAVIAQRENRLRRWYQPLKDVDQQRNREL